MIQFLDHDGQIIRLQDGTPITISFSPPQPDHARGLHIIVDAIASSDGSIINEIDQPQVDIIDSVIDHAYLPITLLISNIAHAKDNSPGHIIINGGRTIPVFYNPVPVDPEAWDRAHRSNRTRATTSECAIEIAPVT